MQKIVILAVILGNCISSASIAQNVVKVVQFSPTGLISKVDQVRVQFSGAKIALGQERQKNSFVPFTSNCDALGTGRWLNPSEWVFDFAKPLPPDTECTFKPTLAVTTQQSYQFKITPSTISRTIPYGSELVQEVNNGNVEPDQIFVITFDHQVPLSEIPKRLYFTVNGANSGEIGVEILDHSILKKIKKETHEWFNLNNEQETCVAIRAKLDFPSTPGILLTLHDRNSTKKNYFRTTPLFNAEFSCSRDNPKAPCSPISSVQLRFNAPVATKDLQKIKLIGITPNTPNVMPQNKEDDSRESHQEYIAFKNPFKANSKYRVEIPTSLKDIRGRTLSNISSFPLEIKTGGLPLLAKFPGEFGILESDNAVLPVSVRNIEKTLSYSFAPVSQFTTAENAVSILNWLSRVSKQHERNYHYEGSDESSEKKDPNASAKDYQSIFKSYANETKGKVSKANLPTQEGKDSAEVLGIPLNKKGLQIVELESKILGKELMVRDSSLYSSTAVLVTNLGVHFKRAKSGQSLVWVTELSTGKPVANAEITIQTCKGRTVGQGTTKKDGTLTLLNLPDENALITEKCDGHIYNYTKLVVIAKKGDDFSFALDSWQQGIEPWRFNLNDSFGSNNGNTTAHTVMDRDLLQPGQIVHFKHYLRDFNWNGLKLPSSLPQSFIIQHSGSDQKWNFPVQFNAQGIAFSEWKIPESAILGTYSLILSRENTNRKKKPRRHWETSDDLSTGSFEVQEFRLPTLNLAVKAPLEITSGKKVEKVSLQGTYISGGPASDLPVEVRFMREKVSGHSRTVKSVVYGQDLAVKTGIFDEKGYNEDSEEPSAKPETLLSSRLIQKVNLDSAGSAYFEFPKEVVDTQQDGEVHYSINYTDPNGEIQTHERITSILSRDRYLGVPSSAKWYFDNPKNNKYEVVLGDVDGKPVAGENIEVTIFEKTRYTHRTRLVGGFYGYHSTNEMKKLSTYCSGKTNDQGKIICTKDFPHAGNFFLESRSKDSQGKELIYVQDITVYGENANPEEYSESDRMTLTLNQDEFEAGQTANVVVQSSFKKSTALVTVEREGILDSFTTELSGEKPVISVPIKKEYSPNVVISVLAVRGRLDAPAPTGMLDLAKPSFKLGLVTVKIGKKSHQLPITVKTPKAVYQIRETVPVEIETKPGAEVSLAVIDQALLKIKPNGTWDLLDRMIVTQNYQVHTATSQINVIGKRHFGKKATPFGGGGGKMITRELLDSLVAWIPKLKADSNGKISTQFKLNDSISSFAIVAIGSEGLNLFGSGKTLIAATQDLQIISSVPPVLREKDQLPLSFILRNTTANGMQVKVNLVAGESTLPSQELEVPGQSSKEVKWNFTIPDMMNGKKPSIPLQISAVESEGAKDSLKITPKVQKLVPSRVISGILQQLSANKAGEVIKTPIQLPKETLAGQAGVRLQLLPRLSTEPESSLQYLREYEFNCLEQQTSKAIGLPDLKAWKKILASLKTYQDSNGLLKFFPQSRYGSIDLTAYFLKMSALASSNDPLFSVKNETFYAELIKNLKRGMRGEIRMTQTWWPQYYTNNERIHALDALSLYEPVQAADYEMIKTLTDKKNLDHNLALTNVLIHSAESLSAYKADLDANSNELLSYYHFENTHLRLKQITFLYFGPLAASPDGVKARTLLSFIARDQKENATKLLRTMLEEMKRGYFDTTPGNALALTSIRAYRKKYEKEAVSGKLVAQVESEKGTGTTIYLPIKDVASPHTLTQSFQGSGKPWSFTLLEAAIPTLSEINQGYHIEKKIESIQSARKGKNSKGDTYKVSVMIEAKSPQNWVVLRDPIPTGASILSTEGSDSNAWVAFEERRMDRMQVFFEYLPQGKTKYTYTVRLNQIGNFALPSTRAEAMYDPTQYGEIPNAKMDITP